MLSTGLHFASESTACYDRWWEARRHWGALIAATTRKLERQTLILGDADDEGRERLLRLAMSFAQALVLLLRPSGSDAKVTSCIPAADRAVLSLSHNLPAQLAHLMSAELVRLRAAHRLADIPFQMLDRTVGEMVSVLTYLFCFLLPFGFATSLGWATPFATALVAYTFFGLDSLGDELEERMTCQLAR
jgi:putative membrane protein